MSRSDLPCVTIVILNYQRRDTLCRTVAIARGQEYPNYEVLVVDNASTDGSGDMVEALFPDVRLVRLPVNIGCAARNHGVAAARGEIVVTIDNDVLLTSPSDLRTVVELFRQHPSMACINFRILNAAGHLSRRDWCHPRRWSDAANEQFLTDYVLEGASAFRRRAFEKVGGYWAPLFIGHEGLDLAFRLLDAGYDLLYTPDVSVIHLVSATARPSSRIYYTFTRNCLWVALRNHRPLAAAQAILSDVALMAFSSGRARHWGSFFHGLWDGLVGIPQALSARSPLRMNTYDRLKAIRASEPTVIEKLRRHWREQPI